MLSELVREYEIFDAHTHIYPDKIAAKASESIGNFYGMTARYSEGSAEKLLSAGGEYNIRGYMVCSVATVPGQVPSINAFIASQCGERPEFVGFGALHPATPDPGGEIARIRELGLRGLKLHPDFQRFHIDDRAVYPIYEAAQGTLPILLHMGDARTDYSRPRRLKTVLEDFPRLTVVAAHLGGWEVWDDAKELLRHDNVFFDTSSVLPVLPEERATEQILSLGAEKCFFGTDYPAWDIGAELTLFFRLNLTRRQREMILSENFLTFLNHF
ncbi:MAG: amidohydrolase family protein [Oscillospiraceae bacterium]|jgi:predicted TIM-barrel fold metal-dependent hydrolase|nr:amidohydrolase family protein [Oscillospiraceae bacterium]